jgi:hypothetical protein
LVTVLYAVVVTPDAGIPRYLTEILFVPDGGAPVKFKVVPTIEYVDGSCITPVTATIIEVVLAGATDIVNDVCVPVPLNVSVWNAMFDG